MVDVGVGVGVALGGGVGCPPQLNRVYEPAGVSFCGEKVTVPGTPAPDSPLIALIVSPVWGFRILLAAIVQ